MKKIFTIKIEDHQDQLEVHTFHQALMKKFAMLMNHHDLEYQVSKVSPGVAWISFMGFEEGLRQYLPSLEQVNDESLIPDHRDHWWIQLALNKQIQELETDLNRAVNIEICEKVDLEMIQRSLCLIKEIWPEADRQIQRLVQKIVVVQEKDGNFRSATAAYSFGAVFLNPRKDWNAIHYMDTWLHESGHLSLQIKQSLGRMIKNLHQKTDAPLRDDQRWLNGILHAAFVLWRMCEGLNRLKNHASLLSIQEKTTIQELLEYNWDRFRFAMNTLEKEAEFTNMGQLFFDELTQELNTMHKRVII